MVFFSSPNPAKPVHQPGTGAAGDNSWPPGFHGDITWSLRWLPSQGKPKPEHLYLNEGKWGAGGSCWCSRTKQGNLKMSLLSHLHSQEKSETIGSKGQRAFYFTREKYLLKTHVWFQVVRARTTLEPGSPFVLVGSSWLIMIHSFISKKQGGVFTSPESKVLKVPCWWRRGHICISLSLPFSPYKAVGSI